MPSKRPFPGHQPVADTPRVFSCAAATVQWPVGLRQQRQGTVMDSSAPPPNLFQQIHDHDPTQREEEVKVHGIEHYALQIKETADKLVQGRANRGDVKLLSVA